eukprot:10479523-Alexandrium_andersonii.AAC.1
MSRRASDSAAKEEPDLDGANGYAGVPSAPMSHASLPRAGPGSGSNSPGDAVEPGVYIGGFEENAVSQLAIAACTKI